MRPLHATRRRWLRQAASLAAALAAPAWPGRAGAAEARTPVVVLTAYPEELTARIEAAFEKAHPGLRLQLLWRMPADALPYLQAPDQGGVDVYWSASPRTFAALKRSGSLKVLAAEAAALPNRIGGTAISDPERHFVATEVAGYGFALNPRRLATRQLPVPQDWPELAGPAWAGEIALPIPARVGFAPVMVDIVLQAFGWERGWALWSAIAANAALVGSGSTFITDEVASGRRALGLTIDFFAASAAARGAALQFAYPRHGGINPGHVAILGQAPHPQGAQAFVDFVLSEAGQRLLTDPAIRKLPVRPSVYAGLPAGQFNPFEAAQEGGYDYDNARGQERLGLIAALFEQALVADHAQHQQAWGALHAAEAASRPAAASARALLQAAPLAEAEAAALARGGRWRRLEGAAADPREAEARALEQAWRQAAQARRREALALLG